MLTIGKNILSFSFNRVIIAIMQSEIFFSHIMERQVTFDEMMMFVL
jgi:hypothetical protein